MVYTFIELLIWVSTRDYSHIVLGLCLHELVGFLEFLIQSESHGGRQEGQSILTVQGFCELAASRADECETTTLSSMRVVGYPFFIRP